MAQGASLTTQILRYPVRLLCLETVGKRTDSRKDWILSEVEPVDKQSRSCQGVMSPARFHCFEGSVNLDCLSTSLRACFSSWSTACSTRLSTSGVSGERHVGHAPETGGKA